MRRCAGEAMTAPVDLDELSSWYADRGPLVSTTAVRRDVSALIAELRASRARVAELEDSLGNIDRSLECQRKRTRDIELEAQELERELGPALATYDAAAAVEPPIAVVPAPGDLCGGGGWLAGSVSERCPGCRACR